LRSFVQHELGTSSSTPSSTIHTLHSSPHASPTSTAAAIVVVVVVVVAVAPAALVRPSIALALLLLLGEGKRMAAHDGGVHLSNRRS
jgi:hypothetical protein